MIVHKYNIGENKIKIESAESIEDAKENRFKEGEYHKYYVNGKRVDNYLAMVRFIIDKTGEKNNRLIPDENNIKDIRTELFKKQSKMLSDQMNKIRQQYSDMNIPDNVIQQMNEYIDKIDPITNIRIAK